MFAKIIQESSENEKNFEQMFGAAHEFLKSQSLAKYAEKIEEVQSKSMTAE